MDDGMVGGRLLIPLLTRALCALLTAWGLSALIYPVWISQLRRRNFQQVIRDDGPASHVQNKQKTPTMGGCVIMVVVVVSVLLWGDIGSGYVQASLVVMLAYAALGLTDDLLKWHYQNSRGLPARYKYLLQSIIALVAVIWFFYGQTPVHLGLIIPACGWWSAPAVVVVVLSYGAVVGTSNAVNLTDGLDGLAILPIIGVSAVLGYMAYHSQGHGLMHHLFESQQALVVPCAAVSGAGLGFLWFNITPAQLFMGDVGSLSLGAFLGIVAMLLRQELALLLLGGVFVVEALSVMMQVIIFKRTGKRFFKMAPLHHHFELKGWSEPQIVMRFGLCTVLCMTFYVVITVVS